MTTSLYSPSWYRVAGLRPKLKSHAEIYRHHYRGELWYVLQDCATGRFQRFNPIAYFFIGLMDGQRTVQEIWDLARIRFKEESPTQEEVIHLLSQLHSVDILQSDVMPDTEEILRRFEKRRHGRWKQNLRNPLFMRFSLFDPEKFLGRFQKYAKPFFSWKGAILWLAVVCPAVFTAGMHWPELTQNITDRILAPANLILMWFIFPILKTFHEFAHGFAVKTRGGEVHEMGIMFLVFTPIPYIDASSASAFREKKDRILVGVSGMAVEVFLAAISLFIWVNIEPGLVRSVAYNVIFIAGVSSILFNGNPLLRYDAYYILSDLLEIPNLGPRGSRYVGYLFQRYLLGIRDAEPPPSSSGERFWFVVYTVSSLIYRISIYVAIVLFIAGKFFFIGVLFACWALVSMVVLPSAKGIKFLITSPRIRGKRGKAILTASLLLGSVIVALFLFKVPLSTCTEGVLWVPEKSFVRAKTEGFVNRLLKKPGERVEYGMPLIECIDPLLVAQVRVLESKLIELRAIYDFQILSDRVKAEMTQEEIKHITEKLRDIREREQDLTIRSETEGTFIVPMPQDLPGRFLKRGELVGYVLERSTVSARVVVAQADVDLVRQRTHKVQLRFPETLSKCLTGIVQREVPAATDQLPGRALTQDGGGPIAIDPRDRLGVKAFQKVFLFDIEIPGYEGFYNPGGRVYVRFDHGKEPLPWRWYRALRQLFLKKFNV